MTAEILRREAPTAPAVDTEERTVSGIAVPYGQEIELYENYFEQVAPGAWEPRADGLTGMKLLWRHSEVIGTITAAENRAEGLHISARISETTLGNDVYALVKDGAIDRFSIGFIPLSSSAEDNGNTRRVTHTSIDVREVSLVPWPAYEGAKVEEIRQTPQVKENAMATVETLTARMDENTTALDEIRAQLADLNQRAAFTTATPTAPAVDTRSAAEFLCDLVEDRGNTRAEYNDLLARAFTGTKSDADPTMTTPTWVADLTRLFSQPDTLKPLFSTGVLPDTGMELEYGSLDANTITVAEYTEGEDVIMGTVTLKKETTPITAYAGGTSITRRAIERTRLPLLQRHLEAMALAGGAKSAAAFAAAFAAAVEKQNANKISLNKDAADLVWADLSGMVIDAAVEFRKMCLTLDGLVVNVPTFKTLAALTDKNGRPLMNVTGTGVNQVGTIDVTELTGGLSGLRVTPNYVHTGTELGEGVVGTFYHAAAIRSYDSPLVQLQDENILNLSKNFSVYRYCANAVEIPAGLIPLKLGA